jgi:hypothetical protein
MRYFQLVLIVFILGCRGQAEPSLDHIELRHELKGCKAGDLVHHEFVVALPKGIEDWDSVTLSCGCAEAQTMVVVEDRQSIGKVLLSWTIKEEKELAFSKADMVSSVSAVAKYRLLDSERSVRMKLLAKVSPLIRFSDRKVTLSPNDVPGLLQISKGSADTEDFRSTTIASTSPVTFEKRFIRDDLIEVSVSAFDIEAFSQATLAVTCGKQSWMIPVTAINVSGLKIPNVFIDRNKASDSLSVRIAPTSEIEFEIDKEVEIRCNGEIVGSAVGIMSGGNLVVTKFDCLPTLLSVANFDLIFKCRIGDDYVNQHAKVWWKNRP